MRDFHKKENPVEPPTCCRTLGEELLILKWIHSSLSEIERIPSCNRRDALKSALTSLLGDSILPVSDDFVMQLRNAKHTITDLQRRIESENADRQLWDSNEPKISDFSDSTQQTINRWLLRLARPAFKKGCLTGLVLGVLITLIVLQFTH